MINFFFQDFFFLIILFALIFYVFNNFLYEPILDFFNTEANVISDLKNDSQKIKNQASLENDNIKKIAAYNKVLLQKVNLTKELINKEVNFKFEIIKKNATEYKDKKKKLWTAFCQNKQAADKVDKLFDLAKDKIVSGLPVKNLDNIMNQFIKRL